MGLLHMLYYQLLRAHLAEIWFDRVLNFIVFVTTLRVFLPSVHLGSATTSLPSAPSQVRFPALHSISLLLFFVQLNLLKLLESHSSLMLAIQKFYGLFNSVQINRYLLVRFRCTAIWLIICGGRSCLISYFPTAKFANCCPSSLLDWCVVFFSDVFFSLTPYLQSTTQTEKHFFLATHFSVLFDQRANWKCHKYIFLNTSRICFSKYFRF